MDDQQPDDQPSDDQPVEHDGPIYRAETVFEAEPSAVWQALTDPVAMADWLERPVEFTLEPGADGTIGDHDDATVLVVEEVDEERRLVFRWASATEVPTVVEFELVPRGGRTHLTIVERPVLPGHVARATARAHVAPLAA